jgi:hypothetical protein
VQEQFAEKFAVTPVPYGSAVSRLIERFSETGSVLDAERSGRPSKLNNKKLMGISDSVLRSASKSLRKLAQEKHIGLATAHKAVRDLFAYKVTELGPVEYRHSWTSLPTPFIDALWLSERTEHFGLVFII